MAPSRHPLAGAVRRAARFLDAALVALTLTLALFAVAVLAADLVDGPATSVITFRQGR